MRPIHIQPSHKGLLHKDMGVPANKPISLGDLTEAKEEAAEGADPAEAKRVQFAINAKRFRRV